MSEYGFSIVVISYRLIPYAGGDPGRVGNDSDQFENGLGQNLQEDKICRIKKCPDENIIIALTRISIHSRDRFSMIPNISAIVRILHFDRQ